MRSREQCEVDWLAVNISNGGSPRVGTLCEIDARLGCEDPGNWSRWIFEADAEQIKSAYERAAEWAMQISKDGSFCQESQEREARAARYYRQVAAAM